MTRQRLRLEVAQPYFKKYGLQVHRRNFYPQLKSWDFPGAKFLVAPLEVPRQEVRSEDIIAHDEKLLALYEAHGGSGAVRDQWEQKRKAKLKSKGLTASLPAPDPAHAPNTANRLGFPNELAEKREDEKLTKAIQALKELVPAAPSIDRQQVEALIRELGPVDDEKLERLVEDKVAALIVKTVEIKLPNREPVKVEGQHCQFPLLFEEIALGNPVFVAGPAGTGKTTAAREIAKQLDLDFFIQGPVDNKYEVLGFKDAGGKYQPTAVYNAVKACSEGQEVVLLVDEIDRSFAQPLTALHSLCNGIAPFPNETLEFDVNKMHLVATGNTWGSGADADFVGSNKLDAATLNRYTSRIYWGYDEGFELTLACSQYGGTPEHVKDCFAVRKALSKKGIRHAWSPRDTFAYCKRRAAKKSRKEAFAVSSLAALREADFKAIMGAIGEK